MTSGERARSFAARIVTWQRSHGRHDLPWQNTRDAYRIWLSEIMLQQTQVTTVPYHERFSAAFPTLRRWPLPTRDDVPRCGLVSAITVAPATCTAPRSK